MTTETGLKSRIFCLLIYLGLWGLQLSVIVKSSYKAEVSAEEIDKLSAETVANRTHRISQNGHLVKSIVQQLIIENETSSKMVREAFQDAEKFFRLKSHKRSDIKNEHQVISFYEEMKRHKWIKGKEAPVFDAFIALKLANTLSLSCSRQGLIKKETHEKIKTKLIKRASKDVQAAILNKSCLNFCHFLKYIIIKS